MVVISISTLIFFFSLIVICTIEYVFGSTAISISLYNNTERFLMFFVSFSNFFLDARKSLFFSLVRFYKQRATLSFLSHRSLYKIYIV